MATIKYTIVTELPDKDGWFNTNNSLIVTKEDLECIEVINNLYVSKDDFKKLKERIHGKK
jgi:hypothetical protein